MLDGNGQTADSLAPLRVLLENADDAVRDAQEELFVAHGFDVLSCGGPRRLPSGCPLIESGQCDLVDDADIVFFDLDLDRDDEAAVLDALRASQPDLPVVVEIPISTAHEHAERLAGCTVIAPFDPERLLHAIEGPR